MKEKLFKVCEDFISNKILAAEKGINELMESSASETKSSMGDKYETSREMINLEKEKFSIQIIEAQKMQKVLTTIQDKKPSEKAGLGSLVKTNVGNYYLSIAIGKVSLEGADYFFISQASPIGQLLTGKKVGEKFDFNGREFLIKEVLLEE